MFDKLDTVAARFEELGMRLMEPNVTSDPARYTELMKEYRRLEPVVEKYREYKSAKEAFDEAKEMLDEGGLDPEMRALAQEQYDENREVIESASQELKILLLPRDPNDDKNVIVEIRGGAGGEEAALFAGVLYRMYTMYAESRGWQCEVLGANETELGGFKEISFSISGEGAYSRLKYESGVHRVQRVPETETQGRIHTSTATVAVLPEAEDVEVEINDKDIRIDIFHSGGAGGQNVNKVASAVRITHFPTGIVVTCQDERSQLKNKERAFKVLRSRLYDYYNGRSAKERTENRRSLVGTGDRSERIRTYNFPQSRVTDHRIGVSQYNLDAFIMGDIDSMVEALTLADREALLASETE